MESCKDDEKTGLMSNTRASGMAGSQNESMGGKESEEGKVRCQPGEKRTGETVWSKAGGKLAFLFTETPWGSERK